MLPIPESNLSQATFDLTDVNPLAAELLKRGISEKVIAQLLRSTQPGQEIVDQIEYFDHVKATDVRGRLASPTEFLVSLIRENVPVPETFQTSRKAKLAESEQAVTADSNYSMKIIKANGERLS